MLKNYLRMIPRILARSRNYTLINGFGLTLGITCALIIFTVVRFELSYDDFHFHRGDIYRLITVSNRQEGVRKDEASQFPLGENLRAQFPAASCITETNYAESGLISITRAGEAPMRFQEQSGLAYVEPEFFTMFDFPWISGNPAALKAPYTMALSESQARKFFGTTDVIGKSLRLENQDDFQIVGVVKDFPANTDFPFTMMASWESLKKRPQPPGSWYNTTTNFNTFVQVNASFTKEQLLEQLPGFIKRNMDAKLVAERNYDVQPLSDVHFNTDFNNYSQRVAGYENLWALGLIALFLIITACINFVNLATAQAMSRSKEVGVRKVLGANRLQLMTQFLAETFIITVLSAILSVGIAEILISKVGSFLGVTLTLDMQSWWMLSFIGGITVVAAFGSGFYPALILSGFRPVAALKGRLTDHHSSGIVFRKGLVILQFVISQVLIIGTLVVIAQMRYFKNRDMGFNKEAIVLVGLPENDKPKLEMLRHELTQSPGILNTSFAWSSASSGATWATIIRYPKGSDMLEIRSDVKVADENYLSLYGMRLLSGRNYLPGDTIKEFVINETLMHRIGFQNPQDVIGQYILYGRRSTPIPIAGVVADFNTGSLHNPIRPTFLGPRASDYQEINIKIDMDRATEALAHIEKVWSKVFPEFIYEYHFLDERIANFYREEQRVMTLFQTFAAIAILIGCLGLIGLVSFLAERKTKEIGVRKVLGASVTDILGLFGLEFFKLIVAAFIIAGPVAYYAMDHWLNNFAFRVDLGIWVFVMALAVSLLIAVLTVGYRSIKTATANPIDALKYE